MVHTRNSLQKRAKANNAQSKGKKEAGDEETDGGGGRDWRKRHRKEEHDEKTNLPGGQFRASA